jgi:hypothetical protein
MKELGLKESLCLVTFFCNELDGTKDCVHHKNGRSCKFMGDAHNEFRCNNSIAQVQAISKHLKHIGLELSSDGFNAGIYRDIRDEVNRAKELHKNTDYTPADWFTVLGEETGEIGREINNMKESGKPMGNNYVTELIQVATVCVRMIEDYQKGKL